jgi:hypothetical protein
LRADCDTETVGVEEASIGTLSADVGSSPGLAEEVVRDGFSGLSLTGNAGAILNDGSIIASATGSAALIPS